MSTLKKSLKTFLWKKAKRNTSRLYYDELLSSLELPLTKQLTRQQIAEIQDFYVTHWGRKLTSYDLKFHEVFYNITGYFSPQYIPTSLYRSEIIYRLNDYRMKDAYVDKNILHKLFGSLVKEPRVYLRCINGFFYTQEYELLSKEEALNICSNISEAIIKPSIETTHGDNVALFCSREGIEVISGKAIEEVLDKYSPHFILQHKQSQHPALANLNETSLNTIRIVTYWRSCGEIVPLRYFLRIGGRGKVIDNVLGGGISVKIDYEGHLDQYASIGNSGKKTETTDSDISLHNYQIPAIPETIETCLQLHRQLPYFSLVAWDMAIDENGVPVLIEWNVSPNLAQQTCGPAFGTYTEEILQRARKSQSTRPYVIDGKPFRRH